MSLVIYRRTIVGGSSGLSSHQAHNSNGESAVLRLAFLGCEVRGPYGPHNHTAELFCDLICASYSRALAPNETRNIELELFAASGDCSALPDDVSKFDGVILPGSFSSAYQTDQKWILELRDYIQDVLVEKSVPTLGVCFGHQLYAHSFKDGNATKCPSGPQAGRKTTHLTSAGRSFLNVTGEGTSNDSLDLFYTHGDMVERLPSTGISLGGNDHVPIQAAIYFSSPPTDDVVELLRTNNNNTNNPKVIAVTFQAHPEFCSSEDKLESKGEQTFCKTVDLMNHNGDLSEQDHTAALSDAATSCKQVNRQSLDAMAAAGRLLGWFR
mmetsp:Transcript_6085/g.12522  ORF Transcript_6085/g.12522 Transcript_6085/m.12522 type:complete len:325 (-) Transcript_6085:66-1040(-)